MCSVPPMHASIWGDRSDDANVADLIGGTKSSDFELLPLGCIVPLGWLKSQLQIQAAGLGGHLDETWPDVGANSGWLGGTGESWERGPYFLDGLIPLAYLLDDGRLKAKAQRFADWTIESQKENGMFGPVSNDDWWPRMVMIKALIQYQEATHDARVIPFMERYFAYQLVELPTRPLKSWGKFRWQDQVLTVFWLYERNGDPALLKLAKLLHTQGYDWVAQYDNFQYKQRMSKKQIALSATSPGLQDVKMATHGVNNGEAVKTGAVWSKVSGSSSDRQAVLKMISELDQYHGLPNGMFSCDEHLAGRSPSQGSELCTVVEYMFSLEQSLAIMGDASLGDRLEKLAFNALPGAMTDDMWGAPIQPAGESGRMQFAQRAVDYRRPRVESIRSRTSFRMLHGEFQSGVAEVHNESVYEVCGGWACRCGLQPLRSPNKPSGNFNSRSRRD